MAKRLNDGPRQLGIRFRPMQLISSLVARFPLGNEVTPVLQGPAGPRLDQTP